MDLASNEYDISFLAGQVMQQLALGQYESQMNFSDDTNVCFRQYVILIKPDQRRVEIGADNPEQTKELYFLLGQTYRDASILQDKTLQLDFADGCRLTALSTLKVHTIFMKLINEVEAYPLQFRMAGAFMCACYCTPGKQCRLAFSVLLPET